MPDWLRLGRGRAPAPVVPAVPAVSAVPAGPAGYAGFKVVVDDPAPDPGLGFDSYATALAEMIQYSRAEFAVGVFGGWGSGKTTLMEAVRGRLATDDRVVTVWFSAWRYEKDPNLIVPLLDVLRDELRARDAPWARSAAIAVGRASRALLAAVTLSVDAIPGFKIDFEPDKFMEKISKNDSAVQVSFYHAAFEHLHKAIADISGHGARRVVIFVDDLDRCLPASALEVLESMKLLFGERGCVFVVALDDKIVQEAVDHKYGADAKVSGTEYIKKIFQVPFNLPRTSIGQLPDYLDLIEREAGFGRDQLDDFHQHVRPHFGYLADRGAINPREIKLLINSYVLQLKVLWPRLGDNLNPDIVLALQCMKFRTDWSPFHDQLIAEPQLVLPLLREAIRSGDDVLIPGVEEPVPPSLVRYLSDLAWPLLQGTDLRNYLVAAESTWSAAAWIPEARALAIKLRRSVDALISAGIPGADRVLVVRRAEELHDLIAGQKEPATSLRGVRRDLEETTSRIFTTLMEADSSVAADPLRTRLTAMFDRLDVGLRDYQRYAGAG